MIRYRKKKNVFKLGQGRGGGGGELWSHGSSLGVVWKTGYQGLSRDMVHSDVY